ncbi:MAG: poly-gamma-glutamate hydrolase family protein [Haloferacaceae archaeon]
MGVPLASRRRLLRVGVAGSASALAGCLFGSVGADAPTVRGTSALDDRSIYSEKRCFLSTRLLRDRGLRVGDQVRLRHADDPDRYANFTVTTALSPLSPTVWLSDGGQRRLGDEAPFRVRVSSRAVRSRLSPAQANARTEITERTANARDGRVAVTTPHGGEIEPRVSRQVRTCGERLRTAGVPAARYAALGYGDAVMGAFDRWHVTSTDVSPRSYPEFGRLLERSYDFAVAFHGLADDRLVVGGLAPRRVKATLKRRLEGTVDVPVRVAEEVPDARTGGRSPANFVNRIAPGRSLQLEQPLAVRRRSGDAVARTVAEVVASHVATSA